jgi:hypothetical protein
MNDNKINIQLLELEAEARSRALLLCDKIIGLVPKFDGKKPDKRFDTALKAIDKGLSFETRFNSFIIKHWIEKRMVQSGGHTSYLTGSDVSIIHASIQSSYQDGICQNGTIDGKQLIAHIETAKGHLQKNITEINKDIQNIETILKRFKAIQDEKEKFNHDVSWTTRGYFNLKV